MLAADKLQLQSAMKQKATALKEKEFNLHRSNMGEFQNQKRNGMEGLSFILYHIRHTILMPNTFCASIFYTATIGTIAAVLAGLDITMFIEFTPHDDSTWVRYSSQ